MTVHQNGRDREVVLNADDESILDAVLHRGADLPHVYKGGICATRKCKALYDRMMMETNYSLEPDELAADCMLNYQAPLLASDVVVDFDVRGVA